MNQEEGSKFLSENAQQEGVVTLPSGLQYKIVEAGDGDKPGPTGQPDEPTTKPEPTGQPDGPPTKNKNKPNHRAASQPEPPEPHKKA